MHTCPRCDSKKAETVSKSPVAGAWEVYQCQHCFFTWRSSEPETITNPEKYNPSFKIDPAKVETAVQVPAVPKRKY
ncbi:phenolic acid decarboxylase [Bacillus glycinifermentans]|uniref:non-oxidative hydroxyarylic acid decarboxylases subunit D n=1 Tax=Bacillus glycinifermentans TaxID=1664069 RepID=UPI0006542666|nr:non-oxidative hydroxyarylic acid decarboxylases subunit D [Bacillus glycinifermentans]KMM63005.1 phenolic acid decarboxylase [Bacillus glycinifermentans]MEC0494480.1 non-oxidative hydroxyarylic acid decarboxylases subunit D [Bacillus glycinifermentans]MEC0539766.1 non-oxidative hydroxyarylic acid decarboxylases subunit D [Bacillus glycinifermentans]